MPAGSQKVEELDFNKFHGRAITVDDLMSGMNNMGFQASSIGEAVRIINDMVSHFSHMTSIVKPSQDTPLLLLPRMLSLLSHLFKAFSHLPFDLPFELSIALSQNFTAWDSLFKSHVPISPPYSLQRSTY
jgi:hypothetical protein